MSGIRKITVAVLVLSLVLSLVFTGCAQNEEKKAETTAAAASTDNGQSKTQELKPVALTWYYPGDTKPDQAQVFEAANKAIKEKINATVNFQPIDFGSYGDKLKVIIATGEPYDICWTSSWLNFFEPNALKAAYYPLDDLLANYAPKLKAYVAEKYWDAARIRAGGPVFAVPSLQYIGFTPAMMFKKDIVEKYNLTDAINNVKTYEDMEPILKTVKEKEPGLYTIFYGDFPYFFDESVAEIPGLSLVNALAEGSSYKVMPMYDQPSYAHLVETARDWYLKGYIPKDVLTMTKDLDSITKSGKIFCTSTYWKPGIEEENKAKYGGIEFIVKPVMSTTINPMNVRPTMNAISKTSENPERAIMFLELMNTDKELYNLLVNGISGVHYNLNGEYMEPVEGGSDKYSANDWVLGSVFNGYLHKGDSADKWEVSKKLNDESAMIPLAGFVANNDAFASDIPKFNSIYDEFASALKYGAVDPVTILPSYRDKMSKAGMDKYIVEIQKQLDAWLAANAKK